MPRRQVRRCELITGSYATEVRHPFSCSFQSGTRSGALNPLRRYLAQRLVKFDSIPLRILDPREPPVIKVLRLLDLDPVRLELLEKRLKLADTVIDYRLTAIGRQRRLRLGN